MGLLHVCDLYISIKVKPNRLMQLKEDQVVHIHQQLSFPRLKQMKRFMFLKHAVLSNWESGLENINSTNGAMYIITYP